MDLVRVGLSIRALRRRRGWTQAQLGERCGWSASSISRLERAGAASVRLDELERVLQALAARLSLRVLWQGEDLDRLLDRDHASIVERLVRLLGELEWVAIPEATFQLFGERGSIDILAWHPPTGIVLVIEVKSVVPDVQATLGGIDRKARLAPQIAEMRGWRCASVARLLVLPHDRTSRRRVAAFGATFDRVLPARTREVRQWLARPSGPLAGVLFLSDLPRAQARQRVRSSGARPTHRRTPNS